MTKTDLNYIGKVRLRVWEKSDGEEKLIRDTVTNNLLMTTGKESMLKQLAKITGGGQFEYIGVGDSTTAASASQVDLQASSNKVWKAIASDDRVYVTGTVYVSTDFGYSEANFTWNEIALRDDNSSPLMIARLIDSSPLVKTTSKRAIVEWQITVS